MKVFILSLSDISGGAARAAYRIHNALRKSSINSIMHVVDAYSGDWTVEAARMSKFAKTFSVLRDPLASLLQKLMRTDNSILHSPAILPSHWSSRLNKSDADVLHLHWINGEMMSVKNIGQLHKPVVWTLHDMWAFCGAEHYTEDFRWRDGYKSDNRPSYESGVDLNRWVWKRKCNAWKNNIHIVTPSHWLAECVKKSVIFRNWPVTVVHNAINTDVWKPVDKLIGRKLLNLPSDVPLILFGAMGGSNDPRKGFDLLKQALKHLHGKVSNLQLVIFGQLEPHASEELGFPVHYMGHLHDDLSLSILYSSSDILIIPSRQDNLPNTGVEALSCGTPVVAFDTCGLPDIVTHKKTGYLAKAFEPQDLSKGIQWVLNDRERHSNLCNNARKDAVARFSYPIIAKQYQQVYKTAIEAL